MALLDAVRCRSRSWAARTFGAAPHYASRNDEASIRAGRRSAAFQDRVIISDILGSFAHSRSDAKPDSTIADREFLIEARSAAKPDSTFADRAWMLNARVHARPSRSGRALSGKKQCPPSNPISCAR
jgi:hypothetical protein